MFDVHIEFFNKETRDFTNCTGISLNEINDDYYWVIICSNGHIESIKFDDVKNITIE